MRIGFDASALDESFKAHAGRGTGRYVKELTNFFYSHAASHQGESFCFEPDFSVTPFQAQSKLLSHPLSRVIDLAPFGRQTLKQQLLYPNVLKSLNFDYLHFPAHIDAPSRRGVKTIVTVLDLIPLKFASLYRPQKHSWRFELARKLENDTIRNASLVLCISECTARDVQELLGIPRERIRVTYLGVDQNKFSRVNRSPERMQSLASHYDLDPDRPWVLYVGGIDQRKNIEGLTEIFASVCKEQRSAGEKLPQLLLVGNIRSDQRYPKLQRLISEHALENDVAELGYVPDEDLSALYGSAAFFLFPSLYEGFGLPPLEAMAAGCPVLSSREGSLREVLGEAALTFEVSDTVAATRQALTLLKDEDLRMSLSTKGNDQAARFTWEETGAQTLDAYRSLHKGAIEAAIQPGL